MTNRLRTEGTDHLLAAGRAVGARRFVAQSFAAWRWARTGGPVKTEADPLDPDPRRPCGGAGGIHYLEQAVTATMGRRSRVALRRLLRSGHLDQPRAPDAVMAAPIRKRQFPIVGDGGGVFSTSTSTTRRQRPWSRSSVAGRASTTSRRRARAGEGVAAGARERAGRQAAKACPALVGSAGRR